MKRLLLFGNMNKAKYLQRHLSLDRPEIREKIEWFDLSAGCFDRHIPGPAVVFLFPDYAKDDELADWLDSRGASLHGQGVPVYVVAGVSTYGRISQIAKFNLAGRIDGVLMKDLLNRAKALIALPE